MSASELCWGLWTKASEGGEGGEGEAAEQTFRWSKSGPCDCCDLASTSSPAMLWDNFSLCPRRRLQKKTRRAIAIRTRATALADAAITAVLLECLTGA